MADLYVLQLARVFLYDRLYLFFQCSYGQPHMWLQWEEKQVNAIDVKDTKKELNASISVCTVFFFKDAQASMYRTINSCFNQKSHLFSFSFCISVYFFYFCVYIFLSLSVFRCISFTFVSSSFFLCLCFGWHVKTINFSRSQTQTEILNKTFRQQLFRSELQKPVWWYSHNFFVL